MAKREPAPRPRCDHSVANWCMVGSRTEATEHRLVCRQCETTIQTKSAAEYVPSGVLFKGPQGLYGPFSPRGWLQ